MDTVHGAFPRTFDRIRGVHLRKHCDHAHTRAGGIALFSISDAVITTDAATRVTYINAAAASLLGLELKAVEGRRIDEVIHLMDPQTSKAAANLIGQSAFHGKVFRREQACLMHRPDGSICYVMDVVTPVLSSTGVVTGMVIVLHDATRDIDRARDLQHRAMHDPLTGLSNRADFEQQLRTVFRRAHHLTRPAAVVARIGGDEFAVILDNCAEERAIPIGQHLLRILNPLSLEWPLNPRLDALDCAVTLRTDSSNP